MTKERSKISVTEFNGIVSSSRKRSLNYLFSKCFGIGFHRTQKIITKLGLPINQLKKKLQHLPRSFRDKIYSVLLECDFEMGASLRRSVTKRLKTLNALKNLRSFNYLNGLPVRGQRTKTNARTSKRRVGRVRKSKVTR